MQGSTEYCYWTRGLPEVDHNRTITQKGNGKPECSTGGVLPCSLTDEDLRFILGDSSESDFSLGPFFETSASITEGVLLAHDVRNCAGIPKRQRIESQTKTRTRKPRDALHEFLEGYGEIRDKPKFLKTVAEKYIELFQSPLKGNITGKAVVPLFEGASFGYKTTDVLELNFAKAVRRFLQTNYHLYIDDQKERWRSFCITSQAVYHIKRR